MPSQSNNIFLTTDNLAFALPLISVCACYAYFKYVPLQYALSILGVIFVLYQIRSYSQSRKNKKLTTLDEGTIQDLAGDEDDTQDKKKQEQAAKQRKAQNKLQMRLAQEKKQQRKLNGQKEKSSTADVDMDDDDALLMFAKGSRESSKKKK